MPKEKASPTDERGFSLTKLYTKHRQLMREIAQDDPTLNHTFFTHIGMYAFRADILRQLVRLPVSSLEKAESLEQLRWIEHGYSIQTRVTDQPSMGVDTPGDLEKISKLI